MEIINDNCRTKLWWEIYNLIIRIPRKECLGDAPDAASITTELEKLFNKEDAKV